MSERRKPSTRNRGERPPKRQASSAPSDQRPSKQKVASPVQEDEIPTKLNDGQALPTSRQAQILGPLDSAYQSIAERLVSYTFDNHCMLMIFKCRSRSLCGEIETEMAYGWLI